MLTLNKKLNSLAIALMALSPFVMATIECRADNAPAAQKTVPAPAADPNAAPAGAAIDASWKQAGQLPVTETEISTYVSHFKIKKVTDGAGTHLELAGLGSQACLRHLHVDLSGPKDYDSGVYSIQITKHDFVSPSGQRLKADADCDPAKTALCTRDQESENACVDLSDKRVAKDLGVLAIQGGSLTEDAAIKIRHEDMKAPSGDALKFVDVPSSMGGPLEFKTPETLSRELQAKRDQEKSQQLISTCKDASEKGSRDAFEQLKEVLGSDGVAANAKALAKIEKKVNQTELDEISKKIDEAETISGLNDLIDELQKFAQDHADMKIDVAKLLRDGVAKKALDIEEEGKDIMTFGNAKLKLVERALKVAHNLDRKNSTLKKQYELARLERYKFLANSGNDAFYNDTTRRDAASAAREVLNWVSNSRDVNAAATFKEYQKQFAQTAVPVGMDTPYGPAVVGYASGTVLDQTFSQRTLEDEFNAYRKAMIGSDGIGGNQYMVNGYGSAPSSSYMQQPGYSQQPSYMQQGMANNGYRRSSAGTY